MQALLVLEDGRIFRGEGFGAAGKGWGEVVFNTSLMGYQEILSDPSHQGQIVVMTYPLIGNYGLNHQDFESRRPWVQGFVVKEYCAKPSNWRAEFTLDEFLKKWGIPGIAGVDTRALTRHLRDRGAKMGIISADGTSEKVLVEKARKLPHLTGRDLAREVTTSQNYPWTEPSEWLPQRREVRFNVVAYDYGIKQNILRKLVSYGCRVTVVPAVTPAEEVVALKPDGIFLSNGPGDPEAVTYAVHAVERLVGLKPIFGICLGHQILGLAMGGRTFKLKFGHHGANHPVKNLLTGKVEITAQNHGFAVDPASLGGTGLTVTHVNLNDGTVEGMKHGEYPVFSVQYHPEASPGPHDADYLFEEFVQSMEQARKPERGTRYALTNAS